MYVPAHFALADEKVIEEIMRSSSFATLVASSQGSPIAAHLPVEVARGGDPGEATVFTVIGHMARANPLWRAAQAAEEVLMVFLGPHAYISPTWYEKPGVPTWDYSAVHLYGAFRLVEDGEELYALLRRLIQRHEAASAQPFELEELPRAQVEGMMQGIVGFEIRASRIEAVAKLSQNRTAADRRSVVSHLASRGDDDSRGVAAAMKRGAADNSLER